ncbi:MAG: AarF/ABC1/UbiB kinase family protein, partial [Acidimicrobiia bacterium]|nr:AarF/ABC1/UbiB kinase family protein [Acidimicrobiia bacterium]
MPVEVRHPIAFQGPYSGGAPPSALVVDAPPLTAFGVREIRHMAGIALVFLLVLLRTLVRLGARRGRSWATELSEGLVQAFELLGPTFVKLGQLIASSPGLFPRPLADACLRFLDEVPPFPSETARRIVSEDLGRPVSQIFRSFDDTPLSAASIAQVHACVLLDGRQAVVKVQRPDIRLRMNRDLRIMYRIAKLLMRTKPGRLANTQGVIEDLHAVTNQELNSALEAHRQSKFRDNIPAFDDNNWVTAPEVYWDYCGPRVVAMERMYGTPLDDFRELERRGIDGELMLRRGVKVWMEAALQHGPFHGDVHAGNLWLLEDDRAAYLDFGIMGELPIEYREALSDAIYTVMIDNDYTRIVRAWKRLGIVPESVGPDDVVAAQVRLAMEPLFDLTIGEVSLGALMKQQLEMAEQFGAQSPKELALVTKQLMYFERYAKVLAPEYRMIRDIFLVQNLFPEAVAAKA